METTVTMRRGPTTKPFPEQPWDQQLAGGYPHVLTAAGVGAVATRQLSSCAAGAWIQSGQSESRDAAFQFQG